MNDVELVRGVQEYLARAKTERTLVDKTLVFPFRNLGFWEIISGAHGDYGHRFTVDHGHVHGRYIDAVIYALQQPGFTGDWMSFAPGNCNSGYVRKMEIVELLHDEGLEKLIRALLRRESSAQKKKK